MEEHKVHAILQGKGGVGKSIVAALLAQRYLSRGSGRVVCVDTDPVNATFSGYAQFNARQLEILSDGGVDVGRFDDLMAWILGESADFVVDNGAASFIPFTRYLLECEALPLIASTGRKVVFHTVITGGYGLRDTIAGFNWLAENMPVESKIVVWVNEFFGPIQVDGKEFEETEVFQRHQTRVAAVLRLPKMNEQTFGRDLKVMLDQRLTFAEARASSRFSVISKQRIAMMERQLLDQLNQVV